MDVKLLPCPFCGGKAELQQAIDTFIHYRVVCKDSCCRGASYNTWVGEAEAIEAWNTRAVRPDVVRQPKATVKVDKVTGEVVARYESGKKAAIENGLAPVTVTDAARRKILTAGRYFYRKEAEYDPAEVWGKDKKNRPVIGVHKERGIIRHFISAKEAEEYTGTSSGTVSFNISGRVKNRLDGWQFRYQESPKDWQNVKAKAEAAGIVAIDADTEGAL